MYKAVKIALEQEGYLEKKNNDSRYIEDKTKNAGFNNYTRYARDLDRLGDFYNGAKNGYPWCECFVDWCFVQAYGEAMALTLLCQPRRSAGAGCTQSAAYYKGKGQFFKSPKIGDQIFFTWGGEVEHTGLVYNVDKTTVYTIEGNTSGKSGLEPNGGGVFKKQYSLSDKCIYGYGRPNYNLVDNGSTPAPEPEPVPDPGDNGGFEVKLETLTFGMSGPQVKTLQALLIKKFNISCGVYGCDGDFGNATLTAVKKFQSGRGLDADGIVGPKTWAALLGV